MSTVISTHILGVSRGPIPRHPLRADCYMDLWKNIHSGLRLCIKIRYVYIPSLTFEYVLQPPFIRKGTSQLNTYTQQEALALPRRKEAQERRHQNRLHAKRCSGRNDQETFIIPGDGGEHAYSSICYHRFLCRAAWPRN